MMAASLEAPVDTAKHEEDSTRSVAVRPLSCSRAERAPAKNDRELAANSFDDSSSGEMTAFFWAAPGRTATPISAIGYMWFICM